MVSFLEVYNVRKLTEDSYVQSTDPRNNHDIIFDLTEFGHLVPSHLLPLFDILGELEARRLVSQFHRAFDPTSH